MDVDLELACMGYLRHWDRRRVRVIAGFDLLAADALVAGVRVIWCRLPGVTPAMYDRRSRTIFLAHWMFWADPADFRDVFAHELGHAAVGRGDLLARLWQTQRYGELLTPMLTAI